MKTSCLRMLPAGLLSLLVAIGLQGSCQEYSGDQECDPALGAEFYQCPDGSQVPWCSCSDGQWDCLQQPQQQCPRDSSCDDGSTLTCNDGEPDCPDWEMPAIIESCWLCVNPDTCRPWSEPGCRTDSQCPPAERCDDCARGSCPDCEDCVADCLPHGCPTEDQADCKMPRPDCDNGQVAVVSDGCWVCVDLATCLPSRNTSCDDGSDVLCDMIPPRCREGEILAAQNACWVCVNPATCRPWGEAGCKQDTDCSPEDFCDPCGTSSCPLCGDCLPACTPHGCPSEQELLCNCARPDCGSKAVAVISDGCWICVDLSTCQPTGEGC